MKSREEGFPLLRRSGANFASCCVPRGYAPMLAFSRGRNRAAPLPTHLLRICAGALKWHAPCAIPKLESGQSPTGALPRKRFLAPRGKIFASAKRFSRNINKNPAGRDVFVASKNEMSRAGFPCAGSLNLPLTRGLLFSE